LRRSHLNQNQPSGSATDAVGTAARPSLSTGVVLALALITAAAACADGPRVALVAPDGTSRAQVHVEIADTPAARELGLMYRSHLDENAGMIFVFPAPDRWSFWMKNTEIPLDMIFADSTGKIVGIVENAEPFSEKPLTVNGASLYVLEVNAGFARRHHVVPGDLLKFRGFVPAAG
jgi:uncharacterized membrane protein (UPF0127 family)